MREQKWWGGSRIIERTERTDRDDRLERPRFDQYKSLVLLCELRTDELEMLVQLCI